MALRTYADWEDAVRVARVVYDHSQARMVTKRKTVRKSKKMVCMQSAISLKKHGGISSTSESSKTPPFIRRKPRIDVKKSQRSCTHNEKKKIIQIFIATPLASTICLQLHPSTSISAVKELLQDRLGIDAEKQHLFLRNEMELCDALSLEDHCIRSDTNIELRLVAGLMGGTRRRNKSANNRKGKSDPKPQSESPTSQSDTSADPAEEIHHGEATAGATAREPPRPSNSGSIDIDVDGNQNRIKVKDYQTNTNPNIGADEGIGDAMIQSGGPTSRSDTPARERQAEDSVAGATLREQPQTTSRENIDISIEGDKNRVKVGETNINYNIYVIPVMMDVADSGKTDSAKTNQSYRVLHDGNFDVMRILRDIVRKHDETTIASVAMGSVEFTMHVKSRKGLDSLWIDYCSGELSRQFGEVLITDKLTTEDKSCITVRLNILRSDYEKGCRFFESLQTDATKRVLPVRMSDWTVEHVHQWLLDIGVSHSVAEGMYKESIDGKVLEMYTKDDLNDDYRNMTKRDMRLILYRRERWLESEEQQRSPLSHKTEIQETEQNLPYGSKHDIQDPPMPLTREPEELAHPQADKSSQPAVRPKTPRTRDKPSPKEKTKKVAAVLPQPILEATAKLQQSDKPDDHLDIIAAVLSQPILEATAKLQQSDKPDDSLDIIAAVLPQPILEATAKLQQSDKPDDPLDINTAVLSQPILEATAKLQQSDKPDDPLDINTAVLSQPILEATAKLQQSDKPDDPLDINTAVLSQPILEATAKLQQSDKPDDSLDINAAVLPQPILEATAKLQQSDKPDDHLDIIAAVLPQPILEATAKLQRSDKPDDSLDIIAAVLPQPILEATAKLQQSDKPDDHLDIIAAVLPQPILEATAKLQRSDKPDDSLDIIAAVLPQPILEATVKLQQSDKPDDPLDIKDEQRPHQPLLQAYDKEQHHEAKSRELQAHEKHEEISSGDGQPSIARGISEVAPTNEARLRMLLTGDEHGELDQSYYPVLVANKPATPDENEKDAIARQFGFIKTIKWNAVLDFNSKSKVDGLCKLYHEDRMVSLQQPELFKHIESGEEFRNTIEFPEKTVWVFANGREDDQNIQAPKMTMHEWHKERRKDIEASVTFFSQPSVIPEDRAVIMFFLLSDDDIDILFDTFGKLSSSFKGLQNIVCIAEDPGLYSKFVDYVERWFSKEDIDKRSLVGLKWQEINRIMMRMNGVNQTTKNELPSTFAGQCFLSEKQKDEWNDITVVCKNECENTDMDETSPSYKQFVKRKELDFYHGEKVDWWNFAIGEKEKKIRKSCGHVLKRKGFGEVLNKVRTPLDSTKSGDSLIVTVTLLHQPGAGGSTLARYVLWELHKDYRCVVVNSVTSRTVNQIMEVRHHGYEKHARRIPPVCVLIDNLDDLEVLDLIADLEEKSKYVRVDGGAVCVLLHCKRNADPFKAISAKYRDPDLYIPLTQKLNQTEKKWFQQKYDELEHKENVYQTGDYIPDNLLAFMVMKEEFNKEYITGVVLRILQDIKGNELKLIKLCALLNSYIHEADIPISCCDTFMAGKPWAIGKKIHFTKDALNWEKTVSASFKIMVDITTNRTIKILHRSIAEEALRQTLKESGDQSLADVTLEFLNSKLLQSSSYSRKTLAKTMHNLLIRRERVGQREDTKTEFSVLIEDICRMQGSEKAIKILTKGVEILEDAFVAQQLARFYLIKEKDFIKAGTFAVWALNNNPKNPYFWDTKGRVHKAHFDTLTEPYVLDQQPLSDKVWNEVFCLSFEAMKTFRESYEVSKEMAPTRIVYTGLYTELNVAFRLLQVIYLCVEPFRTQRDINVLRKYLLKLDMPSGVSLPAWNSDSHSQVRELKNRVDEVLEIMDDKTTYYKDGSTARIAGQKLDEMRGNIKKYSIIYEKYYGEPRPMHKDRYSDKDPKSIAEHRRRHVNKLRCGNFRDIFDRAKAIERTVLEESRDLLLQNASTFNSFDLKNLICIYLALSSIGEKSVSADQVYQEFVRPFYAMDRPEGESCWPSYLMMMFLWPIKGVASERRDRYDLTEHITELKKRWDVDRNLSDSRLPQVYERVRRPIKSQMRPRTHFFLGEGDGLQVFAHITELHATQGRLDRRDAGDDSFWQSDLVKKRLVRLEGTLLNATSLLHRFHKDKDPVDIKLAVPHEKLASQESVTFYLGFSWNGPVAYDVTLSTDKECLDDHTVQPSFHQAYPNHILPSGKSNVSPSDNLSSIGRLQMRREELNKKIEELSSASLQYSEQVKRDKDYKRQMKKLKKELQRVWQQDDIYGYDDGYY